ncbi:MAG: rhodanese-like domain-containing protein [Rhodobacteraceae bacterium]|nr:rhodanese-like domain-containing protein [Paracoccaceae bacterium]
MKRFALSGFLAAMCTVMAVSAAHAEGNRYGFPRAYKADISPAATYTALQREDGTVLVDVRSVEEYAGGHPEQSFNIPFPRIAGKDKDDAAYREMSESDFLAEISARFPDRSTPIVTMCQSGGRSVMAANVLAKAGYTNVQSMWTGYLGRTLTDVKGAPVDLNGNGIIDGVTLDDNGKPMSDPGDLDGWAGFNQLPTTTAIDAAHVVERLRALYPKLAP